MENRKGAAMEAYKTICPDCGYVRFWMGYKTGLGKTPVQLQKMRDDAVTCTRCGSKNAATDADRESETGKVFGEADNFVANMIADFICQKSDNMLDILHHVERYRLPEMLHDESEWHSLYVDYHPPIVERLWRQWDDFRIYLHKIHACESHEALFHPHPWPSAMRVLSGSYEMGIGYGVGAIAPPITERRVLVPGSEYEMTDPNEWHYVRPIGGPAWSLMISGQLWNRPYPKPEKPLNALTAKQKEEMFRFFRGQYKKHCGSATKLTIAPKPQA